VTIAAVASSESLPLPGFVDWPIFPFIGDLRVRELKPRRAHDAPRNGEPGGAPCSSCAAPDSNYIWVDDHWRVAPPLLPSGVPVQVFLETRQHLDMHELDAGLAAELGQMIVRLDHAICAVDGIGRVHVNRWGDGGSHFHMWLFGRPTGDPQMLGFCLPMWAEIVPPTPVEEWNRNLTVVAAQLARDGGEAMI
jgi:diadenosine tetraphosphate (Ap4A) HIT family hydrolase